MSLDTWIHCAATLIAIFGLLLVWQQLRQSHRQTRFQALTDLHRELLATDMQRALRFIFSNKPEVTPAKKIIWERGGLKYGSVRK